MSHDTYIEVYLAMKERIERYQEYINLYPEDSEYWNKRLMQCQAALTEVQGLFAGAN